MGNFKQWLGEVARYTELEAAIHSAKDSLQYVQGIPMTIFRDQNGYYALEARPDDPQRPEFVMTLKNDQATESIGPRKFSPSTSQPPMALYQRQPYRDPMALNQPPIKDLEQKRALYQAKKYVFRPPPVTTANWDEESWIRYIDGQNGWRP